MRDHERAKGHDCAANDSRRLIHERHFGHRDNSAWRG
jgi:hypothetical protein